MLRAIKDGLIPYEKKNMEDGTIEKKIEHYQVYQGKILCLIQLAWPNLT